MRAASRFVALSPVHIQALASECPWQVPHTPVCIPTLHPQGVFQIPYLVNGSTSRVLASECPWQVPLSPFSAPYDLFPLRNFSPGLTRAPNGSLVKPTLQLRKEISNARGAVMLGSDQ